MQIQSITRTEKSTAKVYYELPNDSTMAVYVSTVAVKTLPTGVTKVFVMTPEAAKEPLTPFAVQTVVSLLLGRLVSLEAPSEINFESEVFKELTRGHNWVSYHLKS